ncbi:MAG: hypothetical protein A3J76_04160 [Candidatus Moranbacteria bacterium RBG_13_45_13]|nr:MAG: hypothetical protein A3J76_04160 [Candidatus Moranbacteria bacterium RBG_13_45_13]
MKNAYAKEDFSTGIICKKHNQKKAKQEEINFSDFCKQRKVEYITLDDPINSFQREKYLIKPSGKCLDFWCRKNKREIFVEVKTLTNITNAKREKQISTAIKEGIKNGKNIIQTSEVFDPIPELKVPFETFLREASKKFKNVKKNFNFPKILLLSNVINIHFACHAIFLGAYDSYSKINGKLAYVGMRKRERGLFDKTGSNVSALVYWNKEAKCFNGVANPKAKVKFSGNSFNLFFGTKSCY